MGCSLTDPAGCLADLAGNAAGSIADSAFSDIAKDFGNAAGDAVNWLWGQISGATTVSLTGSAMTRDLVIVSTLAVVVATGLFLIQIIASVLRRDGSGLGRAVKGLLVAFMGSVAAIAVTTLLLATVDALSAGFVQAATGDSMSQMGTAILSASAITAAANPAIVLLLALIVLGAVIVVWGAMMVRKLLIIVTAVFAPLAFAGATADISVAWVRRWIETMVALIVSKLILVIIFVIGLGVLTDGLGESNGTGGASASQSITQAIVGTLILLMGGFAPWLAIRLVHFGGEHFYQVHGQARSTLAGAQSVAAAPQKAQAMAGRVGGGGLGVAGAAGSRPGVLNPVGSNPAGSSGVGERLTSSSGSLGRQGGGALAAGASGAAAGGGLAAAAGPAGAAAAAASTAKGAGGKVAAHTSDASSSTAPPSTTTSNERGPRPSPAPSPSSPPSSGPPKSA
jgi:type IV secretion system protein TrbL